MYPYWTKLLHQGVIGLLTPCPPEYTINKGHPTKNLSFGMDKLLAHSEESDYRLSGTHTDDRERHEIFPTHFTAVKHYKTFDETKSEDHPPSEGKDRKRAWTRAVFNSNQRRGLERHFLYQKYITKPDRRRLAACLGLTDAQVKVWFQNRRMKWRHAELKRLHNKQTANDTQMSS